VVQHDLKVFPGTYLDSVVQMSGTRAMLDLPGVQWAAAAMATQGNLDILKEQGFPGVVPRESANDLFLAVVAEDAATAKEALEVGQHAVFDHTDDRSEQPSAGLPRTLDAAVAAEPATNVAVISVPGEYAGLEVHKALTAGLDVLLFSDNVSVSDEIELKDRAAGMGRLVMGPGAGTAMLGRTGLGFANATSAGRVAVVAAAGTGAQEAMSLLDRWGAGVSHVIGLGGRELSQAVGGRLAKQVLVTLAADPGTELVLLVSKPPARAVAGDVLAAARDLPVVAVLIGLDQSIDTPGGVELARTLEAGVVAALRRLSIRPPDPVAGLDEVVRAQIDCLDAGRSLVRGLFSGGTLCSETQVILRDRLGPVYSNTPLDPALGLPAPAHSHVCLDLGEEEYTRGRPHPMIDLGARIEILREAGEDTAVAVIILDVVLGYGAHPDPAAELAPVCAEIISGGGPRIVSYVLGTEADPQGFAAQRQRFADAGCVVPESSTRAALAAAAIAQRNPDLTREASR
jgi:FdrA protein